ncbi:cytochrome c5 [Candidatus Thiomargarita nelsonii]|uniref:Cytochrome c5 n=1 Tax=Candidatus Thiomargarita nelsonii TaxID=1003181 RepID=A0A176S359_9GAMM|nr:cytochrome c5 [Candidatus Thiomargarita nelsonii]
MFGAPKIRDKSMWASRIAQGMDILINHSINGFNAMPAKGGNANLSDEEIKNAVAFMVSQSQ